MNLLTEMAYNIERIKLMKALDWEGNFTSLYDEGIEELSKTLYVLLKQPRGSKTNIGVLENVGG